MLASSIPAKFQIPFANNAGSGYIRPIPQASQIGVQPGAASLTDGFPPVTMNPGGWPFGQDFNGLLNQITLWNQWQATGGLPSFDGTFSTSIGGYPRGALLSSSTPGWMWLNTVDNNTTNPDSSGTGWLLVPTSTQIQNQTFTGFNDTGSADALVITPTPACTGYARFQRWTVRKGSNPNATTTPNIVISGLAPRTITNADGSALVPGALPANCLFDLEDDGTHLCVMSVTSPGAIIKGALFPYFIAQNNASFTSSTLFTNIPYTGYAVAIGDPTAVAGFNESNSLFTCPTGEDGLWYFQGYANSIVSGDQPAAGNGQRLLHGSTIVSASTSPDSVIVQNQVSAFFNMTAGDTAQFVNFFQQTGVHLSFFYFMGIRFGRTT